VNTLLVDPPAAPASGQPPAANREGGQPGAPSGGDSPPPTPPGRTCCNCDAPIGDDQQWCLQCGAGQPGSLGERPNWRPLTTLALAAALLTGAAAAAGAAALGSPQTAKPPVAVAVAQTPPAGTPAAPGAATPGATTPPTPGGATPTNPAVKAPSGGTGSNPLFPSTGNPPKIPATAPTPKSSGTGAGGATGSESSGASETGASENTSTAPSPKSESKGGSEQKAQQPSAILLDTDAASTYNPYNYPEAGFGDPALAIDGEALTAWTGQVQPSSAPNMAEGLLIDLKTPTKLGAVKLATLTPGMTVQLYGADGHGAPSAITEPGWKRLSATRVLKKRETHVKLHSGQAFRFVVVWIVKAPDSTLGTPQTPAHVDLNEVELFPPAS
jgi:hypothetical protein